MVSLRQAQDDKRFVMVSLSSGELVEPWRDRFCCHPSLRQAQGDKVIYQGDKNGVMGPLSVMVSPVVMVSRSNHAPL